MATRQRITTTTRRRVRKTGKGTGYKKCPTCKGSGRVRSKR